jgi:hypothetical protein
MTVAASAMLNVLLISAATTGGAPFTGQNSHITRSASLHRLTELKGKGSDVLDALISFFEPFLELCNGKVFHPQVFAIGVQSSTVGAHKGHCGAVHPPL